jgi:hypothetical protein
MKITFAVSSRIRFGVPRLFAKTVNSDFCASLHLRTCKKVQGPANSKEVRKLSVIFCRGTRLLSRRGKHPRSAKPFAGHH